jgi:2-hydroxychromene-2-carboxylate isomerase
MLVSYASLELPILPSRAPAVQPARLETDPKRVPGKVIDYYFSVLSDWAYFGGERLERLARRHGAKINHMPIRLAAIYDGTGGIVLQKRSKQRQDYRIAELRRWRDVLGIPINFFPKHYPADDELASGVIIAAKLKGLDAGVLANAILRAIWAEERNIADAGTLTRIAEGLGFDGAELVGQAGQEVIKRELDRYTIDAQQCGVFGSPFYLCEGEIFWGQDRLDFLEGVLYGTRGIPNVTDPAARNA